MQGQEQETSNGSTSHHAGPGTRNFQRFNSAPCRARNKKLPTVQHRTMQGQEQETSNGSTAHHAGPGTRNFQRFNIAPCRARNKKLPTVQHRTMQGQEQETYNGSKSLDAGPGTPDILLRETSVYQPTTPHQRLHIDVSMRESFIFLFNLTLGPLIFCEVSQNSIFAA